MDGLRNTAVLVKLEQCKKSIEGVHLPACAGHTCVLHYSGQASRSLLHFSGNISSRLNAVSKSKKITEVAVGNITKKFQKNPN